MGRMTLVIALSAAMSFLGAGSAWAKRGGCGDCGGCSSRQPKEKHHKCHEKCAPSCAAPTCSPCGYATGCGAPASCGSGCATIGCATGGCGAPASCGSGCGACGHVAADWSFPMMADATAAPVTLVVNLPADAQLTVEGQTTKSTSATRTFTSPALETGKDYVYTMTAIITQNGKNHSVTRQVTVRAGETTNVNLDIPGAVVSAR